MDLGDIEPVAPREIWPNEASDFTPWLAENISKHRRSAGAGS